MIILIYSVNNFHVEYILIILIPYLNFNYVLIYKKTYLIIFWCKISTVRGVKIILVFSKTKR